MADFDRVSGRRCHSELGKMSSRRTFATVIGATGETNCREKQTYKIAHLSQRKSAEIRLPPSVDLYHGLIERGDEVIRKRRG